LNKCHQAGTNGTDGTDLTSTLTTQGDIVYRDGSGLQRLGAGTSGQVLQTGGTGANPSWVDASGGDVVKLASGTLSGSSVSIDGYYTSDYDFYKLIIMNVYMDTSGRQFQFRLNSGGSALTGSNYRYVYKGAYTNSSVYTGATDNHGSHWVGDKFTTAWDFSIGTDRGSQIEMNIYDPLDTTNQKFISWTSIMDVSDSSHLTNIHGGGYYNGLGSSAFSGVTVFPQANNFSGGIWKLYGYRA